MPTLNEITKEIERLYPPSLAESWDKVGQILGSGSQNVNRILVAVDIAPEVAKEAVDGDYDLLITHHPLFLRGTSFLSEDEPKGQIVASLIRAGCALFNAHTNADSAHDGVADALADLVGIKNARPLLPREDGRGGAGRIGEIEPQTLEAFAKKVASVLPAGPTGLFVGGDLDRVIKVVAVSGGSGDSFLADANGAGADVFLTADLRHHPAIEHLDKKQAALLCGSHWATEWPWLPRLAANLRAAFPDVTVDVSKICTEPWKTILKTEGQI
jgi:dinuclear metal center protein, YbgI/SA1388 family